MNYLILSFVFVIILLSFSHNIGCSGDWIIRGFFCLWDGIGPSSHLYPIVLFAIKHNWQKKHQHQHPQTQIPNWSKMYEFRRLTARLHFHIKKHTTPHMKRDHLCPCRKRKTRFWFRIFSMDGQLGKPYKKD